MQRTSEVAGEPFAKCSCRVEPDIDVDIAERSAFDLDHPVRREVAQAPVQSTERVTERRRLEVDGDVGLGLHAEQRREPSGADGMSREALQRVAAEQRVSP